MLDSYGDEVRSIHGVWRKGPLGLPSTNIDKVNELTGAGMPLEEALKHVWTVTRAAKRGFVRTRLIRTPVGSPGAYTEVDVLIEK